MFLYIVLIFAAIAAVYWKLVRPHSYWRKKGVKQGNPKLIVGHNTQLSGKHSLVEMVNFCYKMYPEERCSGIYLLLQPILLIRDPDLIKQITVKDFDHFTDHVGFTPEGYDTLWSKNLFTLKGEKWRDMRTTLSPAFTSSKMKAMFTLMRECAEQFTNYFEETNKDNVTEEVELKDMFTRFTNDVIATCAFGLNCDSLRERDNEFYRMGKEMTNMTTLKNKLFMLLLVVAPKLVRLLGWTLFDKHVEDFFLNLVGNAVKYREENNIVRPDLIHLLMEARNGRLQHDTHDTANDTGFATVQESTTLGKDTKTQHVITLEDMTAQALLFFFAGFDSVATLMSFCSYELAVNPDIQQRLREEIHETLKHCNGTITYEALNKMKYMDMVVAETLRKWPSGSVADRLCTKDYTIEPQRPDEVRIHLKKGDGLWLPYYGIHRDPEHYPNPERFDPERFSDENKANVKPYTYFPFGSGPRNCIASRFALIETKTLIFHLLNKFELIVIEKTPIPMILSKSGFVLNAENGFWVGMKPYV